MICLRFFPPQNANDDYLTHFSHDSRQFVSEMPGDVISGHVCHVADGTWFRRLLGLGLHLGPLVIHQLLALEQLIELVVFERHVFDESFPVAVGGKVATLALDVGLVEGAHVLLQLVVEVPQNVVLHIVREKATQSEIINGKDVAGSQKILRFYK